MLSYCHSEHSFQRGLILSIVDIPCTSGGYANFDRPPIGAMMYCGHKYWGGGGGYGILIMARRMHALHGFIMVWGWGGGGGGRGS